MALEKGFYENLQPDPEIVKLNLRIDELERRLFKMKQLLDQLSSCVDRLESGGYSA